MFEAGTRISPRDRDAILQALRSGVVPRRGLQHVQVARSGGTSPSASSAARAIVSSEQNGESQSCRLASSIACR